MKLLLAVDSIASAELVAGSVAARPWMAGTPVMVFLNMFPVNQPEVMIANASQRFDAAGNLTGDAMKDFIRQLLQNLVDWTRRIGQTQAT